KQLPEVPYVCLRLPTGGGKTLLAAHSVSAARDAWIEKDFPLVLWLVPSNTIRRQTVETMKNTSHPYRQALNETFSGRVRVFDIADFAQVRPHDLRGNCCIVVGTIQTLRVSNTDGRKVYAHNEELEPHFSAISGRVAGLETLADGAIKFSFANLMHLHQPLMIVDEAHNAVTGLTREMQQRVNPAAIIEFSATPRSKSNILYSVSALELKREQMIKLPIILSEHDSWQNAVDGAIVARSSLAEEALNDPGHIRPIVLFQAQPKNQEVTVKVLKDYLLEDGRISEEKIVVATGEQRELDGVDLFDRHCPVEYVITIEALKEGWDCSFAYIFCSVSRVRSAVDVEQLLGRVLRMPHAERRKARELNQAYAFLSEADFGEAARTLVDKLIAMGFEEDEANENIEYVQPGFEFGEGAEFPEVEETPDLTFRFSLDKTPDMLAALQDAEQHGITVHETSIDRIEVEVSSPIDTALEQMICAAVPAAERAGVAEAIKSYQDQVQRRWSPARRGEVFNVPGLSTEIQGELKFADTDMLMEFHDWSLSERPARLEENEFAIRETARSFEIDLDGKRVTYKFANEREQLSLDVDVEGWTQDGLILWLDGQVRQPDISQSDLIRWLSDLTSFLMNVRKLHISALMRCKFILARRIRDKIDDIRRQERNKVYQKHLIDPGAKVEVSFDSFFAFRHDMYRGHRLYRGQWKPARHFLGPDQVPAFDCVPGGEEEQCAQVIDSMTAVKFWVRNVARDPASFWLPTVAGKFYPDFVAQLEDERLLVVEYKGAHLAKGPDTAEKQAIGKLWQRKSNGKGIFVVVEKSVSGRDMRQQLSDSIKQ
ncbi:MAG: restriction endonuclease subunit R, partial [Gammaproteobacteria bacterium]|nr:restriction endonuclease subunit R [Gammaproteobacteria bacterium]